MIKYGKNSEKELNSCHRDLILIFNYYAEFATTDISIINGLRSDKKQIEYFKKGLSTKDGIIKKSKHQANEDGVSMAVDIQIYTNQDKYKDSVKYNYSHLSRVAGSLEAVADTLYKLGFITHKIRWGGDWDSDGIIAKDHKLKDLCHFELAKA